MAMSNDKRNLVMELIRNILIDGEYARVTKKYFMTRRTASFTILLII